MSNEDTQTATGNAPTHIVYQVRDGGQKGYWTRMGAAWAHKDGKGFNIQLEGIPLDGRLTMRAASETK